MLRVLHAEKTDLCPAEVALKLDVGVSKLSYHAIELADLGVTRKTRTSTVGGSIAHFYASRVSDNKLLKAILAHTREDDQEIDTNTKGRTIREGNR
jgi:hypothetical protein